MYEAKGALNKIEPVKTGISAKGTWSKVTFIIDVESGKYPKKIAFDAWGDKIEEVENVQIGTELTVGFDLSSNPHNGNWYTNAKAIYIKAEGSSSKQPMMSEQPDYSNDDDGGDDLPF